MTFLRKVSTQPVLLASVGIVSTPGYDRVLIRKYEEILKARELPFFRFASGRQQILNDLSKIIKQKPKNRYRIPEDEKRMVMELYRDGFTPGEIAEKLWHEHGLARTTAMIYTLIRRENKKIASDE